MIREMVETDIERMAEISVFGWRTAYRGIINDEILFSKITIRKKMEQIKKTMGNSEAETFIYDDGLIKGMLTVGKSRDKDKLESFELWGIYVEPLMQGEGIGSKLVEFCERKAKSKGYNEIILWTLEDNIKARGFYEYHGFMHEGTKKEIKSLEVTEIRYIKRI